MAVPGEVRVEGHAEEAAFVEGAMVDLGKARGEVEDGAVLKAAAGREGAHDADLVRDEGASVGKGDEGEWGDEALGDELEGEAKGLRGLGEGVAGGRGGGEEDGGEERLHGVH